MCRITVRLSRIYSYPSVMMIGQQRNSARSNQPRRSNIPSSRLLIYLNLLNKIQPQHSSMDTARHREYLSPLFSISMNMTPMSQQGSILVTFFYLREIHDCPSHSMSSTPNSMVKSLALETSRHWLKKKMKKSMCKKKTTITISLQEPSDNGSDFQVFLNSRTRLGLRMSKPFQSRWWLICLVQWMPTFLFLFVQRSRD